MPSAAAWTGLLPTGFILNIPTARVADVELIVATIFDQITGALARGDRVELRGFGAFSVKQRSARIGHNPRTGVTVQVSEKTVHIQDRQGTARPAQSRRDEAPHLNSGTSPPNLLGLPSPHRQEPRYGLSPGRSASGVPEGACTDARRRRSVSRDHRQPKVPWWHAGAARIDCRQGEFAALRVMMRGDAHDRGAAQAMVRAMAAVKT